MNKYAVPLDPRNPGQFLACSGLFELADLLAPGTEGRFGIDGAEFFLETEATLESWELRLEPIEDLRRPVEGPLEPLLLLVGNRSIALDWWLDELYLDKSAFKTWGGQQRSRVVLDKLLDALDTSLAPDEAFLQAEYMTTRLGLDARSAWEPLDLGYSPNDESSTTAKQALTYPWIEVLAAVGLQGFRPAALGKAGLYRYCAWQQRLTVPVARAAAACAAPVLAGPVFEFPIVTRGQGYKTFLFARGV